ncbi:hypothetical protein KC726_01625 [Candidatus Woesebacteria bacterium]|nr:hypothetical protein [Candidatus Woesebacteria bacterium]
MFVDGQMHCVKERGTTDDSRFISIGGKKYVARFTKSLLKLERIVDEYKRIGFFQLSGSIRRRNYQEQLRLAQRCNTLGVITPSPICHFNNNDLTSIQPTTENGMLLRNPFLSEFPSEQEETIIYPFIPGVTLSTFLATPSRTQEWLEWKRKVILRQLYDLNVCHKHGIIMGDRWGPNQIVFFSGGFALEPNLAHIDIDLDISKNLESGEYNQNAAVFEVAQVLYHILFWINPAERESTFRKVLKPEWQKIENNYDKDTLYFLLEGHRNHFNTNDVHYSFPESTLLTQL